MFSFGVKLDEIWNTIKVRVWPIFWINFWKWNYFLFFFFMRWADTVNSWQNEINHVRFNITWNFYQSLFSSQMTCVILVFPAVTQGLGRNSILMLVFGYKDPNVIWFSYNDMLSLGDIMSKYVTSLSSDLGEKVFVGEWVRLEGLCDLVCDCKVKVNNIKMYI